jgi:hypothetical protein
VEKMVDKDEQPRDPRMVVLQAELAISAPESVRTWLEKRAAAAGSLLWNNDEAIEWALLERKDPLINSTSRDLPPSPMS